MRSIEAALWGTATRDAEIRQSKAGNEFAVVSLMIQDGALTPPENRWQPS